MKLLKTSGLVLTLCLAKWAFALPEAACTPINLKSQTKIITLPGNEDPNSKQIYFLKNISAESLWVDHPREARLAGTASAGWASYIRPGQWSAILVIGKNFALSCAVIQPGKVQTRFCAEAISVCTLPKATLAGKRKGSYWLVEDQSWEDTLATVAKRGVKFN